MNNDNLDYTYLVYQAKRGALTDSEMSLVVETLQKSSAYSNVLIFVLGRMYATQYKTLIEQFLASRELFVAASALKVLVGYWGGMNDYIPVVLNFLQGNNWDTCNECQMLAMQLAGAHLRHHQAKELLEYLFQWLYMPDLPVNEDILEKSAAYNIEGVSLIELEQSLSFEKDNTRRERIRRHAFNAVMNAMKSDDRITQSSSLSSDVVGVLETTNQTLIAAQMRLATEMSLGYGVQLPMTDLMFIEKDLTDINEAEKTLFRIREQYLTDDDLLAARQQILGVGEANTHTGIYGSVYVDHVADVQEAQRYLVNLILSASTPFTRTFHLQSPEDIKRWRSLIDVAIAENRRAGKSVPAEAINKTL